GGAAQPRRGLYLSAVQGAAVGERDRLDAGGGAGEMVVDRDRRAGRVDRNQEVGDVRYRAAERHVRGVEPHQAQRVEVEVGACVADRVVAAAGRIDVGVIAVAAEQRVVTAPAVDRIVASGAGDDLAGRRALQPGDCLDLVAVPYGAVRELDPLDPAGATDKM